MSDSVPPTRSIRQMQADTKARNAAARASHGPVKVKQVYRPKDRTTQAAHLSIRLAQDTVDGINKIRAAFYKKYPQDGYPTLSAAFEYVILKNAHALMENPALLSAEVEEFKRRYTK